MACKQCYKNSFLHFIISVQTDNLLVAALYIIQVVHCIKCTTVLCYTMLYSNVLCQYTTVIHVYIMLIYNGYTVIYVNVQRLYSNNYIKITGNLQVYTISRQGSISASTCIYVHVQTSFFHKTSYSCLVLALL